MSFSHYAMQKNTCFYLKNCIYLFLYCKLFMLILEPTVKRKAYQHVLYTFFPLWSLFSCTILEIIFHKHWVFILFCLTPNGNLGVCFIAQLSCASLLLVTTFLLYFEWLVLGNFYTSVLIYWHWVVLTWVFPMQKWPVLVTLVRKISTWICFTSNLNGQTV